MKEGWLTYQFAEQKKELERGKRGAKDIYWVTFRGEGQEEMSYIK